MTNGQRPKPPPVWKLTPLSRALVNFNVLLESPGTAPFFRSVETIEGLLSENKRLSRKCQVLYLASFLGACAILMGPLPQSLEIDFGTLKAPLSALPQQFFTILTAVIYAQFIYIFSSMLMLTQMLERILQKEGPEAWQFFAARFDATLLWGAALSPKTIGYGSPKRHMLLALVLIFVLFSTLLAHSLTVCTATVVAAISAFQNGSIFLEIMGAASAIISLTSFLWLIVFVTVKMPFRIKGELIAYIGGSTS